MISLLIRFTLVVLLAILFAWLADQPGDLTLRWLGYEIQTSLMAAMITLAILVLLLWITWSLIMWMLDRPGALGSWFKSRRQRKGREALSNGLIAVAAGDKEAAQANARTAVSVLGDDPMARLLDAQAAQMRGDSARVLELFDEMTRHPETRLLGLRGLHTEAVRQHDVARARELAEEAARLNPKVSWASQAVLSYQSADEDWPAISRTIDQQKQAKLIDRKEANAKHAVVLTAQAKALEESDPVRAGELALEAHKLEPSLVPAAVMAANHVSTGGNLRKASKIIEKTWALVPHPDLAEAYGNIRAGDSALDRLKRVTSLVRKSGGIEGAVALAMAAIDAREWKAARRALEPYAHDRPQARICGLMAEIEEGEFGDKGRSREWLARAVRAPRDPAWTADGFISRTWLPASPVTGELGAFRWRVPVEGIAHAEPESTAPVAAPDVDEDEERMPGDDAIPVNPPEEVNEDPDGVDEPVGSAGPEEAPGKTETEPGDGAQEEVEPMRTPAAESPSDSGDSEGLKLRQPDDPGPEDDEKKKVGSWL